MHKLEAFFMLAMIGNEKEESSDFSCLPWNIFKVNSSANINK